MRGSVVAWLGGLLFAMPSGAQVHAFVYPAPTAQVSIDGLPAGSSVDSVHTTDGLNLHGIERAPDGDKPVLLVFHGNESSAMETMRWFEPLEREGYGIVAAEYREYSGNPGTASETGLAADADAFLMRARMLAGQRKLIVIGHSLGAGVAFGLADRQKFDALVTIGAFTRLADLVPQDERGLLTDAYDNVAAIGTINAPLYLVHGTADDTVPLSQAGTLRAAAARAGKPGALFSVQDEGHAPDATALAMIVRAVAVKLANDGRTVSVTLPRTVVVTPF